MTIQISKTEINNIVNKINPNHMINIKQLVMFFGHAHSGHSIIGAIMDAHPDVCITNEINIAKLFKDHDVSKKELESILLYYSHDNDSQGAWHNTEYKYQINSGFQGKTDTPMVIGDKKGGASTRIIMNNPEILTKILDMYGNKVKFINVHRKPIDVIAAYAHYWKQPIGQAHLTRFIENDQANLMIKSKVPTSQWLDIDQKQFIEHPKTIIGQIFEFISVDYSKQQLEQWTSIVKANMVGKSSQMNIPVELSKSLNSYIKKRGNT